MASPSLARRADAGGSRRTNRGLVQSVVRAFDVLSVFSTERPALAASDIARQLHLTRPTVHRLLLTLQQCGAVVQQESSHRFMLSAQLVRFSSLFQQQHDIESIARPYMTGLRNATRETSGLHMLEGRYRIVVAQVESQEPLRLTYPKLGEAIPLHIGAPGKVMLAFQSPGDIESYLSQQRLESATTHSIADRTKLRAELEKIRAQGYAISQNERRLGTIAIAAPLFDRRATAFGAINISGPEQRLSDKKLQARIAEEVKKAAQQISAALSTVDINRSAASAPA